MDMSHDAPNHILIKNGKHEIIKQDVVYENCQKFYIRYRNLGHYVGECRLSPNFRTQKNTPLTWQELVHTQDQHTSPMMTYRNPRIEPTKPLLLVQGRYPQSPSIQQKVVGKDNPSPN